MKKKILPVGYQRMFDTKFGPRQYNRKSSLQRFRRSGSAMKFRYVGDGSGHRAGERWGDEKQIDPESRTTKYSKNSPSFDEGVYLSKKKRHAQAISKLIGEALDKSKHL